jgi:hypothetical protein
MNALCFGTEPLDILETLVNDFFGRKLIFNNYFGISLEDVDFVKTEHSLILRKSYVSFYRIYVMSDDENDLIILLKGIQKNHSINIPTKKDITIWDKVLVVSGFDNFAIYERHFNTKKFEKRGELTECYAKESDFEEIRNSLYSTFSPITGWLPNEKELKQKISNKQIMINRDEQGLSGIIVYTINNKKADLNAWVGLRGQGIYLFLDMFNLLAEKEVKIAHAWINEKNTSVKKIYKIMGFVPDGLKDYIYIKK